MLFLILAAKAAGGQRGKQGNVVGGILYSCRWYRRSLSGVTPVQAQPERHQVWQEEVD